VAALIKFDCFVEDLAEGKHNLAAHQLRLALTNTAPNAATHTALADITEISYTGLSSRNVVVSSSGQVGGLYTLVLSDLVLTTTATVGPFRYVVLYNSTTSGGPLIGYADLLVAHYVRAAA
jgi:hypothetical protein